jgi:hypothetical protein
VARDTGDEMFDRAARGGRRDTGHRLGGDVLDVLDREHLSPPGHEPSEREHGSYGGHRDVSDEPRGYERDADRRHEGAVSRLPAPSISGRSDSDG